MRGPLYTRIAAATGIDFAVIVALIGIIERAKDMPNAGEVAVHASNGLFATVALLHGLAAVTLFWFVSTFAARCLELEGGSGRLSAAMNGSGAVLAGILAVGVGAMWAAHQTVSTDSAALASSLIDGPTLFFPAAVLVGASGIVGVRSRGLPTSSRVVARLSVALAVALVVLAALMLYQDYAWINDTAYIAFAIWVLTVSIIGVQRWSEMDEPIYEEQDEEEPAPPEPRTVVRPAARPRPARASAPEPEPTAPAVMTEPVEVTPARPARRKPMPKASPSKPAPSAVKPKPAARRKPAPRAATPADEDEDIDEFLSE